MKKFKFNLLAGLLFLISASVCAQNAPEKVQIGRASCRERVLRLV